MVKNNSEKEYENSEKECFDKEYDNNIEHTTTTSKSNERLKEEPDDIGFVMEEMISRATSKKTNYEIDSLLNAPKITKEQANEISVKKNNNIATMDDKYMLKRYYFETLLLCLVLYDL